MIRENDINWHFWRSCYCALDRELYYLIEMKPVCISGEFRLLIILNKTNNDYSKITKERIASKSYTLESTKIDLKKEWKKWTDMFYEDYFMAIDVGGSFYNGMSIRV